MRPVRVIKRHDRQWVAACQTCRTVVAHHDTQGEAIDAATGHAWSHITPITPQVIDYAADLADDVETYLAGGEGLQSAARRRGVRPESLARQLRRIGRHDLAQRLANVDRRAAA